jgi:multidrug efflux pump subunit AcrB
VDAASGEITGAVIGSTLTTVLVFVPLAFIVGVYGQFFASLSWSLSIAVLVSMVISLTLVPVCAAKFLAGKPMPEPGPIYRFVADVYERMLAVALRFPWVTLAVSVLAIGAGVLLYTGIPDLGAVPPEKGKPPAPPLVKGLETGLMPAMDEGTFVIDYWAPSGTPLVETEQMANKIQEVLAKNPDVKAYVRRTGAELGLFATQTSRGDIQVVLRPAEDDPFPFSLLHHPDHLLRKPERPKFSDVEAELKKEGKDFVRQKYRRRPMSKIMEEVEDELKENFAEHQLKFELVQVMQDELNDLSGANKPVEIKLFGPSHKELRRLAEEVIGDKLEKEGKGRGIKEVNTNVHEGNPDLMIQVDGVQAARRGLTADGVERQLKAMFLGQIATQVRESAARITDVRVRYPDADRFGRSGFGRDRLLNQSIVLPDTALTPTPGAPLDRDKIVLLSAVARVEPVRTPDE